MASLLVKSSGWPECTFGP